jgi:hypothetical protein
MKVRSWNWFSTAVTVTVLGVSACNDDPAGPAPLPAPTGVSVAAITNRSARVTFGAVTGAESYRIERAAGATSAFAMIANPTALTYDDANLQGGIAYRYRVAAVRGTETGPFSTEVTHTPVGGPLGTVTIETDITANRTLSGDTVYIIKGFIKVANGATLTIQPGTVIHGDFNTVSSSLFILRGARIRALGTAAQPVVFTSSRAAGSRQPGDWGGLIIVGNGIINRTSPLILEGSGTNTTTNPPIDYAGGTNNADDSGELHYVRVEFAGHQVAPNAELNSFTFAAVGSGTRIDHLQALAGLDDHFEVFGGAFDATHLVSYESGDDHFDMSEGYVGRMQYLIAYQSRVLVPRAGAGNVSTDPQGIENDGCDGANCTNGQNSTPFTMPLVANFTLVGTGAGVVDATSGGIGMMLRRGAGGYYMNGVVARWPRAAFSLRDTPTKTRADAGELLLKNVLVAESGPTFQTQGTAAGAAIQNSLDLTANALEVSTATSASLFTTLPASPANAAAFDWTPGATSAARTGGSGAFTGAALTKGGTVVVGTAYRGAVDPAGAKWWEGWTSYAPN